MVKGVVELDMLTLFNTLTKVKERFAPIDQSHIKLYVCGPTVYNYAHIGNARSVVVFDLLFRVLRHYYPKVTYLRNITDVDDKIIEASRTTGKSVREITEFYTEKFHEDMEFLGCLLPTLEAKATDHISQMIIMIESLIASGHAYFTQGHVYFRVQSFDDYGKLSGQRLSQMAAGARVEVGVDKGSAEDFVLWKPSASGEPSWESPWGPGRPGWHIECSAMSNFYLGENFDIHGGGIDLQFPHHENERAQSCSAYPGSEFARFWVHNGFLTVNQQKMSKSLNNIVTVQSLKSWEGSIIRYALLAAHYPQPLDWTQHLLESARSNIIKFSDLINKYPHAPAEPDEIFMASLLNDLNTPIALARLHALAAEAQDNPSLIPSLKSSLEFIGIKTLMPKIKSQINHELNLLMEERKKAKDAKNFALADQIRAQIEKEYMVKLKDMADGSVQVYDR